MREFLKNTVKRALTTFLCITILTSTFIAALLPTTEITVRAAGTKKIVLGYDPIVTNSCTNDAATVRYGGNSWRVIGYNGDGIASGTTGDKTITLFVVGYLGESVFQELLPGQNLTKLKNIYMNSKLFNTVYTSFTLFPDKEERLVLKRTLTRDDGINLLPGYDSVDTYFWPLSVSEAGQLRENAPNLMTIYPSASWWLRSPGGADYYGAFVRDDGSLATTGMRLDTLMKMRAAFNLDTSSILFVSAADGGKPSTGSGGTLTPVAGDYTGNEWRLTCIDSSRSFGVTSTTSINGEAGDTVSIEYSGATTGSDEYISALLLNSTEVMYYGRLQAVSDVNGTASLVIPSDLSPGRYTIKLFNELIDTSPNHIDIASEPVDISLKVGQIPDPVADNFEVTLPPDTVYDGNSKTATANVAAGITGMGDITVKYYDSNDQELNEAPTLPGTYRVKLDVTEGDSYNAKTGITKDAWTFTISEPKKVATPTFSPEPKTYTEAQNVTINCATAGATIYYTTNGSDPTTGSTPYTAPIPVSKTTTIKAIAAMDGMYNSEISSATYTIKKTAPDPTPDPTPEDKTSIKNANVKLFKSSLKYTGKAQKPTVKSVTLNGKTLDAKNDYTVSWSNSKSKKLGTYKVTITGKGKYKDSKTVNYKIVQGDNPLTVKLKKNKLNVPLSKLKKGNQTIKQSKYLRVSKGQGKITYKRTKGDKKISIDKKTGNITVKKSLKPDTYNLTISVKAAGNKNYKAATKKVKVKIVVK